MAADVELVRKDINIVMDGITPNSNYMAVYLDSAVTFISRYLLWVIGKM